MTDSFDTETTQCDICGLVISVAGGDRPEIATEQDFGDDGMSAQQAIDVIVRALERTESDVDDRLVVALREDHGYCVHEECLDETTLPFQEVQH